MSVLTSDQTEERTRKGLMLVLSSPSGAGKTTLTRMLLASDPALGMSVSVTTRPPRANETDGKDYHFIDAARFKQLRDEGALLEWAEVFGNFYGTPRAPVEAALAEGRDVVFDIDWQGSAQLCEKARADLASVFILPPSADSLRERLRGRASDQPEEIARRLAKAGEEIAHWRDYDYVLVNDRLDTCLEQLRTILAAERQRRTRQLWLEGLASQLQRDLG